MAVAKYLFGFFALALFGYLAFAAGSPSEERFVDAFKVSSLAAAAELGFVLSRRSPVNRLVLGANLWLLLGGTAAFLEQWWLLRAFQHFGEASLFGAMLGVGLIASFVSPAGFIGKIGARRAVLQRSALLALAVAAAMAVAVYFRGDVKYAAVLPVIALSWLYRLLRQAVPGDASGSPSS